MVEKKKNHQDTKTPRENTKKYAEAQSRRGAEPPTCLNLPTDHTDEHGPVHPEKPQITQINADPPSTF